MALTVKRVLEHAKDLPLGQAPFGREIFFACTMNNIDVDISLPCQEVLQKLTSIKGWSILNLQIDDLSTGSDMKLTQTIVKWCFIVTMLVILTHSSVLAYISVKEMQAPDFWLIGLYVIIPAMVMWNKMNLLKSDKAKALGALVRTIIHRDVPSDENNANRTKADKRQERLQQAYLSDEIPKP